MGVGVGADDSGGGSKLLVNQSQTTVHKLLSRFILTIQLYHHIENLLIHQSP